MRATQQTSLPTPRPAPEAPAGLLPTQRPAPGDPAAPPRTSRLVRVTAVAAVATVALATAGGWIAQDRAERAERARVAAQEARARVDVVLAAQDVPVDTTARTAAGTWTRERDALVVALRDAVRRAEAAAEAAPHAGDARLTTLREAIAGARALTAADDATLTALRAAPAALAAPVEEVTAAEKRWRAAEERRRAEARAEAERRAAELRAPSTRTVDPPSTAPRIPAGGLVCRGTGGSGAQESSASAVGAAINAYRASRGLPQLAVVRSSTLVGHALAMGTAGGIWHSGGDNIVGCSGSPTASYLVQAWSHSGSHDAQMRRTDVGTMYVGAATQSGWLFSAVLFR